MPLNHANIIKIDPAIAPFHGSCPYPVAAPDQVVLYIRRNRKPLCLGLCLHSANGTGSVCRRQDDLRPQGSPCGQGIAPPQPPRQTLRDGYRGSATLPLRPSNRSPALMPQAVPHPCAPRGHPPRHAPWKKDLSSRSIRASETGARRAWAQWATRPGRTFRARIQRRTHGRNH